MASLSLLPLANLVSASPRQAWPALIDTWASTSYRHLTALQALPRWRYWHDRLGVTLAPTMPNQTSNITVWPIMRGTSYRLLCWVEETELELNQTHVNRWDDKPHSLWQHAFRSHRPQNLNISKMCSQPHTTYLFTAARGATGTLANLTAYLPELRNSALAVALGPEACLIIPDPENYKMAWHHLADQTQPTRLRSPKIDTPWPSPVLIFDAHDPQRPVKEAHPPKAVRTRGGLQSPDPLDP